MPPSDFETDRWFAEHLQMHEPMLRAWLQSRFPDFGNFEDIIQEAYARVLAARSKREVRSPKAFVFATARNLAFEHYRQKHAVSLESFGDIDELSVLDEHTDVAETAARNQEIELMTRAIQALPNRCRQVLTLRNVYGLSQKEIAAQMGIAVRTVEAQVTLGIRKCTAFVRKCRT